MRRFRLEYLSLLFGLCACTVAQGQWATESFQLKAGWTAVYLHVDASHATISQLVAADPNNPIEEIWLWVPATSSQQFFNDPQQPTATSAQWLRWDRYWGASSPLQRLVGNAAYLVRVRADVPSYTWTLKGKPVPPHLSWTSTGLNFIGFSTPRTNPPTWGSFLGPDRALHANAEIYHYPGGPFSEYNPARVLALRTTPLRRGQAYWVRAEEENRYFGPFSFSLQSAGGIHFYDRVGQYRVRLRNATDQALTVTGTLRASDTSPSGEAFGIPPLLLRGELDMAHLTYGFSRFAAGPQSWTLAPKDQPGAEIEITLGLDRSVMTGPAGTQYAGIFRLSDSLGHSHFDFPVSAQVASDEGLWIGNALVTQVQHYLVKYEAKHAGGLAQAEEGSYIVSEIDESLGAVARPFPLRLIVHNSGSGATLLQRVYIGHQTPDHLVVTRSESTLQPTLLPGARRISVAHLPWSENNTAWAFNSKLGQGADISVTVPLHYDDHGSNPFVHTYHPDHDNRNATYSQTLPQGAESYGVTRDIRLHVTPLTGDFNAVTGSSTTLSGLYEETITLRGRGLAARQFLVRGAFALNRVSDIGHLTD
jgi:hypothetical protein